MVNKTSNRENSEVLRLTASEIIAAAALLMLAVICSPQGFLVTAGCSAEATLKWITSPHYLLNLRRRNINVGAAAVAAATAAAASLAVNYQVDAENNKNESNQQVWHRNNTTIPPRLSSLPLLLPSSTVAADVSIVFHRDTEHWHISKLRAVRLK